MSITKQEVEEILNKALDEHLEPIICLTKEIRQITKQIAYEVGNI